MGTLYRTDSPEEVQDTQKGRGKGMESRPKWPEDTGEWLKGAKRFVDPHPQPAATHFSGGVELLHQGISLAE